MTAIIFGSNGQDGFYLTRLLNKIGIKVVGISRTKDQNHIDISNFSAVEKMAFKYQPDFIFHLAAISNTRHEFFNENFKVIVNGTNNILEAVKIHKLSTKVFISGSGLQFMNNNQPITETDSFEARDAYSLCRIQSVYTARYYRSQGINVYVGYFFNHDSPRRSESHLTKKIFETAKRIANGASDKLEIGDLAAEKEYTYAGDIVEAIWKLVNQTGIYEANIGSGICYSVKEWIQLCCEKFDLSYNDFVTINNSYVSPYQKLVSNNSLIKSLGWNPQIDIYQLFELMKNGD